MGNAIQVAAIFGTIGLLWWTLQALRRFRGADRPGPRVQVRQRVTIANGCQLVVVDWDGREMLIATGTQACTVVASKNADEVQIQREVSGAWAH
jgi:hypothetical protein